MRLWIRLGMPLLAGGLLFAQARRIPSPADTGSASTVTLADREQMLTRYCAVCHNDKMRTAGMSVQSLHAADLTADTAIWEKILAKLKLGEMPPKGMARPPQEEIAGFTNWLETSLDKNAAAHVNPGRATLRRMNRAEYTSAVRDLLGVGVDMSSQLPADDSGYGFDNIADVLTVSPTLMDSYMSVAGKIGRLATGLNPAKPTKIVFTVPKDAGVQRRGAPAFNVRSGDLLPLDSRGGAAFEYQAPYDGNYVIRAYLNNNTLVDYDLFIEDSVELKVPLKTGPRVIGMYFQKPLALDETPTKIYSGANFPGLVNGAYLPPDPPKPVVLKLSVDGVPVKTFEVPSYDDGPHYFQANYPRDVLQISVDGPYDVTGMGETPSRSKIFICKPKAAADEAGCARSILSGLATRAYRRPLTPADVAALMKVYESGRRSSDFDHGVELAVEAILVSPQFLFLEERDPPGSAPGSVHPISDLELASRLSFFLWSSLPDQELINTAQQGKLKDPAVLKQQVLRMLADSRARALTANFASQWLYLRNLQYAKPDMALFPEFDLPLRQAMATETEMFFSSVIRDNRPVLDFINSDYTFLNQRLAEYYGIPDVYGSTFRRVQLTPSMHRGGLLGQASVLTVTSFDNRTSVVRRGKWILDNLLAAPPPPPPPNVPDLKESSGGKALTIRQAMEIHRANPVCASCHSKMDPLGFALENYDAIGKWRESDAGNSVDSSAVLPDGTQFEGPAGLQNILLARKDAFVEAFTERLMTYGLGRGLEAYDMPAVRGIRRVAAKDGYRIHDIILGIVQSVPFTMRRTPEIVSKDSLRRIAQQ